MTTVAELHEAHGDVAHLRPNVAKEELHELALFLQDNGWAGLMCLREAVEALVEADPSATTEWRDHIQMGRVSGLDSLT